MRNIDPRRLGSRQPPEGADDESWAFIPVIVGLAALCLLLFFFLTPTFENEGDGARSAPPGAITFPAKP